jgi:Peptidase family M28
MAYMQRDDRPVTYCTAPAAHTPEYTARRRARIVVRIVSCLLLSGTVGLSADRPGDVLNRLRADVEFLSAPALEGRVSPGCGAEVTAQFIAAESRKAGLKPCAGASYLQEFSLVPVRPDPERTAVLIIGPEGEKRFAPLSVLFPDPRKPLKVSAEVVFAGFGISAPELGYDDYAGLDVKGRAVLVFDHEPREADPTSPFNGTGLTKYAGAWYKTWNAQAHGAVALLLAAEPVNPHRLLPAREPGRAAAPTQGPVDGELRIPRFTLPPEALADLFSGSGKVPAEWQRGIEATLRPASRELDGVTVRLEASNRTQGEAPSCNVAGLLEGSDRGLSSETVILCAHYDHLGTHDGKVYPGANDNGSGVAALLEIARRFSEKARRPARSVLLLAFGSEEQLMLGSFHYAANPLRPLETTRAVINLDMIGRDEQHTDESRGMYDVSDDASNEVNLVAAVYSPGLAAIVARANRKVGLRISDKFDRDYSMRALFRCDHLPFLYKGVPAIWIFGGFHTGYHTPFDTPDRINYAKLEKITRLAYQSVRAAAAGR